MRFAILIVICLFTSVLSPTALATSYASAVTFDGATLTYTLNQDARSVTIEADGDLFDGPRAKGRHAVEIGATTAWSIEVLTEAAPGWAQISDDDLTQSKYYSPKGVAVDKDPAHATFGRIYVSEGLGGGTVSDRVTTDGIYVMGADQSDVTSQGNTAYAGGINWTAGGSSSPFKIMVAPDGSLYIADWSDSHSGVWRMDTGSPAGMFDEILDNTGRNPNGLVVEVHGSVAGLVVEGSGADTQLYTLDEDLDMGGSPGSVLCYAIGTQTHYSSSPVEATLDSINNIINLRSDLVHDEDGSWWIAQYRATESVPAPSLCRFLPGSGYPVYSSAADTDLPALDAAYGNLAIHNGLNLLAMGCRDSIGVYIIDVSDPDNPVLLETVPQSGFTQDVAFDAVGNLYVASSSSETLRIWSPGGHWVVRTVFDGVSRIITMEPFDPHPLFRIIQADVTEAYGNRFAVLTWTSMSGTMYQVNGRTDLEPGEWSIFNTVEANGPFTTFTNIWPFAKNSFYRITRILP